MFKLQGRIRPDLLLVVLGLLLASCGGGSDGSSSPPPPPPPPVIPPVSTTIIDISDGHTVGTEHRSDGDTSTGGTGSQIAGLDCIDGPMPNTFHVHSHVSIFLNGEQLAFPRDVGIVFINADICHYAIHTHDKSGKI